MVPVLLILVLGKASFGKMDFSVVFRKKRAMVGWGLSHGGGGFYTQKSERLSGKSRRLCFKSGTSLFALQEQLFWHLNVSSAPGKRLPFLSESSFLMPYWPMDMAPLLGHSCTSD